jgi:hypothetical protein
MDRRGRDAEMRNKEILAYTDAKVAFELAKDEIRKLAAGISIVAHDIPDNCAGFGKFAAATRGRRRTQGIAASRLPSIYRSPSPCRSSSPRVPRRGSLRAEFCASGRGYLRGHKDPLRTVLEKLHDKRGGVAALAICDRARHSRVAIRTDGIG